MQTYSLTSFLKKDPNGTLVKLEDAEIAIDKAKKELLKELKEQLDIYHDLMMRDPEVRNEVSTGFAQAIKELYKRQMDEL